MTDRTPTTQQQLSEWFMRVTPPSGVRRVAPLAAAVSTDTGLVREENQDRVAIARWGTRSGQACAIAAIADGIGGMKEGAACASNALAELFCSAYRHSQLGERPEVCLEKAITDANRLVHSQSMLRGGTTLVALLLAEGKNTHWVSIGDSRFYRASGAELVQLSKDDTIAGQLGRRTDVTLEQSKLLQYIGIGDSLEVHVASVNAAEQGTALLTTDGVHFLERSGGVFSLVVENSPDAGTCVKRLTDLARWAGGHDNASALAIPLALDQAKQQTSPQCLDVWDPFGEIRIVETPSATVEPPKALSTGSTKSTDRDTEGKSIAPTSADEVSDAPNKASPRPKRKRKTRKKSDPRGAKAPQVQLEFSGKDD